MDFKHRTQKVGKRKLAPLNETRLTIKIARLQNGSGEVLHSDSSIAAQTNLREILLRMRNHNAALRRDAVSALYSLFSFANGDEKHRNQIKVLLHANAQSVLTSIAERLVDTEPSVRSQLLLVTNAVFSQLSVTAALPHLPIFCAFLNSALSQLHVSVRLDALAIVAEIIHAAPALAQKLSSQLLSPVSSLLDPQLHAMVYSSLFASTMPSSLGLYEDIRSSHSSGSSSGTSSALVRKKLGNKETRICCVFVFRQLLLEHTQNDTGSEVEEESKKEEKNLDRGFDGNDLFSSTIEEKRRHFMQPSLNGLGLSLLPLPFTDSIRYSIDTCNNDVTIFQRGAFSGISSSIKSSESLNGGSISKLPSDSMTQSHCVNVINHLMQLWLDCGGGESHSSEDSASSLHRLSLVVQTIRLVLEKIPISSLGREDEGPLLPMHESFSLIAFASGKGSQGQQDGAISKDSVIVDRESALRIIMRLLHNHIFTPFPMQSSSVKSNPNNETSGAISILNMRIAELACSTLPEVQTIAKAREVLLQTGISSDAHSDKTHGLDKEGVSENPFGVLARKRKDEESVSPTISNAKSKVPVAWRKYVSSLTHLDRALKSYEALFSRLASFCNEKLDALIKLAGRGMDDRKQNLSILTSLPSLLIVLNRILPHADDQLCIGLLQKTDALFNVCPPRTKAKASILSFILHVMSTYHVNDCINLQDLEHSWLLGFPKLLLALGVADIYASTSILKIMLEKSQRAKKMSPDDLLIKNALRQMTPLFYSTSSMGENEDKDEFVGTFGAFIDYPPSLQRLLLSLIHSSFISAPSLIRALGVLSRDPRLGEEIRSRIVEVTILSLLDSDTTLSPQFDLTSSSTRLDLGVCSAAAFLLTILLARSVVPSTLLGGPQMLVQPSTDAFRGWEQKLVSENPSIIFLGLHRPSETETSVVSHSTTSIEETLDICVRAFRLLSGKCHKENLKQSVIEVIWSILESRCEEFNEIKIRKEANSFSSSTDKKALFQILDSLS